MATICKRATGNWQAKVRRRDFPAFSETFATRAEAERWARAKEVELDRGTLPPPPSAAKGVTVRLLIQRYLREVTPTKKGAHQEQYKLAAALRHPIAEYGVRNVTPSVVAEFRNARLEQVESSTVNRELNVLGHLFTVAAKDWGYPLPSNPVQAIRRPRNPPPRERRLEGDEEERLLAEAASCRNPFLRPIIIAAIDTALREGELVRLDWRKVDLVKRVISLKARDTKNGMPRTVPLTPRACQLFQSLGPKRHGPVFGIAQQAVVKAFDRTCEKAGIEDLHFHDLRHEATSRFFEMGLDIMEVRQITGHRTLAMLLRYTHLRAQRLVEKVHRAHAGAESQSGLTG